MKHVNAIRVRDKHVLVAVVRRFGPISRARIHEVTRIRRSTTSRLVRELLEEKRLVEAGRFNNSMGRKQVLLRLNEEYRFVGGIEFDDETIRVGIMDLRPRIRYTLNEPTEAGGGKDALVRQLLACTRKALQQAKLRPQLLLGIGIADPGLVDSRKGVTVTSSTLDSWRDVPLRELFEKEFHVPVLVEAKTRAKTVAERMLGAGEMLDNMIYVDYGTGIGAGIILDGKLLYGQSCAAGEFGHTHLMEDGPVCKCGSYGCLEAVVGARAVEARVRKAIAEGGHSQALALAGGDLNAITGWTVFRAAQQGDKLCSSAVAEVAAYLGLGLANLVNLFNPSVVLLDHRLELAGPGLLDQIVQVVRRQALTYSTQNVAFRFARLQDEAGVLGVGLMVLEKHFEIPMLKPPRFLVEAVAAAPISPRDLLPTAQAESTGRPPTRRKSNTNALSNLTIG